MNRRGFSRTLAVLCRHLLVPVLVVVAGIAVTPEVRASGLAFTPPRFLPGDVLIGPPAGMQVESAIARGGSQYLAVWNDGRSTPDAYKPFATEGSGTDVYGVRLDANGALLDSAPFVITRDPGDQVEPSVAWNGQHWLVAWKQKTPTLPTYEELLAVRVAADGSILDPSPIVIHRNQSSYGEFTVAGGGSGWVVLLHANGPVDGLLAVRVEGDGTVANPGGRLVHATMFLMGFDLAFAQDEFLIVWAGSFDAPRGQRFTPALAPLDALPFALPWANRVASDGTDFLVVWHVGSAPSAYVAGVRVTHDGQVPAPAGFTIASLPGGTCCSDVTWDGAHYWASWGDLSVARVTPAGQVLDPGGIPITPGTGDISFPGLAGAVGGGLQIVYNHSWTGTDDPKDIYGARVDPSGQLSGVALVSRGAPAQLEADFAGGGGTNLVVFMSRASESGRIMAQRIDDAGNALDPEPFEVATGPLPGPAFGPPLLGPPAAAWNGSVYLIVWSDGLQIFGRRMLPDGSFLDATPLTIMDGHDPDVAAVGGVFLVVGLDFLFDNIHWQATHSMRVDGATGANLDAVPNALGGFAIYARHPRVLGWGDRWLAVWQRNLSHDETVAGTTAAIVLADGTTPGLIDVPLGWRPHAAVSGDRALFTAVSHTIASAQNDIEGIVMLADGTFPGVPFLISGAADKQLRPEAGWNGSEFIVVWEDKRNSIIYFDERTDIYGARISTDGTVLDPAGLPIAAAAVPEIHPALLSIGSRTLLGMSSLQPGSPLGAYRIAIQLDDHLTTGVEDVVPASAVRLLGARPNPALEDTRIVFEYGTAQPVDLRIFDSSGRLVRTLAHGRVFAARAAPVEIVWDGRDDLGRPVGPGVFFYELSTPAGRAGGRLVMLR